MEQYQDAYALAQVNNNYALHSFLIPPILLFSLPRIPQTAKKYVMWVKTLCWAYWYWFHYCLTLFVLYPSVDDKNKEVGRYQEDIPHC